MKAFLIRSFCTAAAVLGVVVLAGVRVGNWLALLGVALFVGLLNALARPFLLQMGPPLILVSLGALIYFLNVGLFAIGSWVPDFRMQSFGQGLVAAAFVSLVSWGLSLVFRDRQGHYHLITYHPVYQRTPETSTHP